MRRPLCRIVFCVEQSFKVLVARGPDFAGVAFESRNKHLGIHRPCGGILIRLQSDYVQQICSHLVNFTASRPIRRANDLARLERAALLQLCRWSA